MSRTADRLSGALASVGVLVVTSILAGIAGSSTLMLEASGDGPRGGGGGCGPLPAPAEHAASPAATPSGSIHRISRNTSTAIMRATLSLARPTVLVIHDDGEALDRLTR